MMWKVWLRYVHLQHVEARLLGLLRAVCLGHDMGHVWHPDLCTLPQDHRHCSGMLFPQAARQLVIFRVS